MMDNNSRTETQTEMVVYAMAQSRDDRTIDIFSSLKNGLVTDYTEHQHIRQMIEELAPSSDKKDKKPIVLRSGKNWASGYLRPDSPGPRGRFRPVLFVAQNISWKVTDSPTLAGAVAKATTFLIGSDEMSSDALSAIKNSLTELANRRKRPLGCGCFPLLCCIATLSIALLWLVFCI